MTKYFFSGCQAARLAGRALAVAAALGASGAALANDDEGPRGPCAGLPSYGQLKDKLTQARNASNGGFNLDMWGTVVNRDGVVCAVAFTGKDRASQWPGSRVVSAQKAYTANAFSLPGLALSTANLYTAVQPGGSLFGLQESNPVDTGNAYAGPARDWGTPGDPMVGKRVGGINVFGGGLALYTAGGKLIGAVGVSGDSSCGDHAIAWRLRSSLFLDYVPFGVGPGNTDQLTYTPGPWAQPHCVNAATEDAVIVGLPPTRK
jgi:uncharacterized protein GlcG (DUF336 family)